MAAALRSKQVATLGRGRFALVTANLHHGNNDAKDDSSSGSSTSGERLALVAVKSYHRQVAAARAERVLQEKTCLARLSHPRIVRLIETLKDDENLYFVLSAILGGSLHKHIMRQRVPAEIVRVLAAEVVSVLRYMTTRGVVHRDLKLNNLLLDENGHIILCDFSSAKLLCPEASDAGEDYTKRTFTVTGSLHSMAPEMAAEDCGHSFAVDWWALGVLLHEMHVGESFPWSRQGKESVSLKESAQHALAVIDLATTPREEEPGPCWVWQSISPPLSEYPCYAASPAALNLIGKLLTIRPAERLKAFSSGELEEDMSRSNFDTLFNQLEGHDFFRDIDWQSVHSGTNAPPWPDFDRRLGFLDLLSFEDSADDLVTSANQAMFEGF